MKRVLLPVALAVTVAASTIVINAGQTPLSFSPDSTTAAVGDVLEFHFFGSYHSAVSGNFSSPCQGSSSGFDSGPIKNQADGSGSVFQVTVNDTNPIWYFCGTPSHCQGGMVGVINPPSSGDSLSTYKSNAVGATTESAGTVEGGIVVAGPSGSSSSSSSSPPSTSAPSSVSSGPPSSSTKSSSSSATSAAPAPSTTGSSTGGSSTGSSTASTSSPSPSVKNGGSVVTLEKYRIAGVLVIGLAVLGYM